MLRDTEWLHSPDTAPTNLPALLGTPSIEHVSTALPTPCHPVTPGQAAQPTAPHNRPSPHDASVPQPAPLAAAARATSAPQTRRGLPDKQGFGAATARPLRARTAPQPGP